MKNMYWWKKLENFIRQEAVLSLAVGLAVLSSFYTRPQAEYIDWEVLCILFDLMLVVAGLKSIKFLDWAAVELLKLCCTFRQIILVLVGITFFASMFVTNDVALITFVPITLIVGKAARIDVPLVVVLQTLAANLGSMFTPMGNPQNLFLYAHYNLEAADFFMTMLLPTLLSVFYIGSIIISRHDEKLVLALGRIERPEKKTTGFFLLLLLINIAAVLHLLDKYPVMLLTAAAIFLLDKKLFRRVDYSLLATFVGFFIFIGNISHMPVVKYLQDNVLNSAAGTYIAALLSSQIISNVPAAMLLSALTNEAEALLLGVNIGGLGTLIASMASVISYKLFVEEHPYQSAVYLKTFLFYNFSGLLLIGGLIYCYLVWF